MNDELANAAARRAKSAKRRLFWGIAGTLAALAVALVVWRSASVSDVASPPSAARSRLAALEEALARARTERERVDDLATKRESEARRLRFEFRREFFRLDFDERAALLEEMKRGELSNESRKRSAAAKAFAKQSEWLEVERERAALRRLSERFDGEIARAESERARWARRLESEETLGATFDELDAESGSVEAVAVVDRLRALTEDAAGEAERPLDAISPEELLAFEATKESALNELVETVGGAEKTEEAANAESSGKAEEAANAESSGKAEETAGDAENKDAKRTSVAASGIPELPRFDPSAVADDAPVRRRLFEAEGAKIVDAANREIQIALEAGAVDVAFAAANDASAELVKLAETLARERVGEFKKLQETVRRASWRPTLDALRRSTKELAESNAGWPETFALLEEAAALAPLAQIADVDAGFAQNLNDLQDLARYYESTDADSGAAVRRRLDSLLGKSEEGAESASGANDDAAEAESRFSLRGFLGEDDGVGAFELVVGPIFGLLGALFWGTPIGIGALIFYLSTRRNRPPRGVYERPFPDVVGNPIPVPNSGPSGKNWQIIGLVFVIGLITAGPGVAALAAFVAALVCAGRFGTALGALGIFAFLLLAFVMIALATALAIGALIIF